MKIYTNTKLIKRNGRIGQVMMIAGMAVLVIGLILNFQANPAYLTFSLISLPLGFILAQIGIFFNNRWGRLPRQEELLNQALKGLDDRFSLYHFETPVDHLLIGPAGVWIIVPFRHAGKISFENGKWRQKGVNAFLKFLAQEGLTRPDLEVQAQEEELKRYLAKKYPEVELPPLNTAMVFLNPKATLEVAESDIPAMPSDKLKDFLRKKMKPAQLTGEQVESMVKLFDPEVK